jgi:hypothetical protein
VAALPARTLVLDAEVAVFNQRLRVGKDEANLYEGGRTKLWLKINLPGWTDPEGRWRRVRLARMLWPAGRALHESTSHETEAVYRRYAIVSDADLKAAALRLDGDNHGLSVDSKFVSV